MCFAAILGGSHSALAGGFEVRETVSPQLMGVAQAGIAAGGSDVSGGADLSGTYVNPAVLAFVKGKGQITPIVHRLFVRSKFTGTSNVIGNVAATTGVLPVQGGNGGNAHDPVIIPAFYAMWKMYERGESGIFAGFSVTAPWGQKTEYPKDWKGRHVATKTEMISVNASPMFAIKVNSKFSVGFGLQLQKMNVELERMQMLPHGGFGNSLPERETLLNLKGADSLSIGWVSGLVLQLTDKTRFGVGYKSEISHRIKGKFKKNNDHLGIYVPENNAVFTADLKTPSSLTLSLVHQVSDWFTVLCGATYTRWSVFDEIRAVYPNNPDIKDSVEPQEWRNTWFLKAGCEIKPCKDLAFRFGYAYDQTPTKTAHRSPRLPDANRSWISCGADWQVGQNWHIALSYVHVIVHDPNISIPITATAANPGGRNADLFGSFKASVDIVTASVTWKFNAPQL